MRMQSALRNAVELWESEDRPYWKYIRSKVVDDLLMDFYAMPSRT